jgi:UDP-galactopyranose mutase
MLQVPHPQPAPDIICLSHLRWNFVFQRPQHLMTRFARDHRVFFVEEPIFRPEIAPRLLIEQVDTVRVVVPHLPEGISAEDAIVAQRHLLEQLIEAEGVSKYVLWYYTPMALPFTTHLAPVAVVYDCMDELSAFKGAPSIITARETELMRRASLVLTGGQSLFEAKRHLHSNIPRFRAAWMSRTSHRRGASSPSRRIRRRFRIRALASSA